MLYNSLQNITKYIYYNFLRNLILEIIYNLREDFVIGMYVKITIKRVFQINFFFSLGKQKKRMIYLNKYKELLYLINDFFCVCVCDFLLCKHY